jgi:hypothetical protein
MRRREFITLLGGAAAAWPLAVRAQQPAMPLVGFLGSGSPESDAFRVAAIWQGLNESGYVEGRNIAFEYRWAEDHNERLPALAAELVRQRGRCHRLNWQYFSYGGQADNRNHPDHLRHWRRSDQVGPRGQPQPARRQHHRRELLDRYLGRKTV